MTINVLFLVLLISTLVMFTITRQAAENISCRHYEQKSDFFRHHKIEPGDIVFLGDSITDGACWDELFPNLPVKNRGINADTTKGVLNRLDPIISGHPAAIFILIGTNDLPWYAYQSNSAILTSYKKILIGCKTISPQTRIYVQSIFPRHPFYTRRIRQLNSELQKLAGDFDYTYLDIFSRLVGKTGGLKPEYTNDQLHLLAAGYDCWVKVIKPLIDQSITTSK
jgi:lysophospholipase L1-like esterase